MLRIFITALAALLLVAPTQALTLKGKDIPETLTLAGHELVLNGAGVRSKFFVDAYIAALYLQAKSHNGEAILNSNEPMAVRLIITSNMITSKRMRDSTLDGFKQSTKGNLAPIQTEVDQLLAAFSGDIAEGDVFDLLYTPEVGVTLYHNGVTKTVVSGLDFKEALFGIWISNNSIQKSLRKAMLND